MRKPPTVYRFSEMPKETILDGFVTRTGLRTDNALVTFNFLPPHKEKVPPHNHPFDQLILIVQGTMVVEVDGVEYELPPGSALLVPPNAMHTGWVVGDETVLNIDVFAPVRQDYLHLTAHQQERFDDK